MNRSWKSTLNDMVPVRARRQIVYPLEILGTNAPSTRVLKQQEEYALNHLNRKLTMEPKVIFIVCDFLTSISKQTAIIMNILFEILKLLLYC